ncbi:hypothetical protein ABE099_08575 [Paenibacillus turicensis]|uniref:hypothetical protein n=1 Tax=Paenibacillus turicensis TaxID=160487 RepID=UPI003D278D81
MKSSSFLCGVFLGAVSAMLINRNKALMSAGKEAGMMWNWSSLKSGDSCKTHDKEHHHSTCHTEDKHDKVHPSSSGLHDETHMKQSNLKQITNFIKSNPEVRKEVEGILKETGTIIPGL